MPTKCSHYAHLTSRFVELCKKFLDDEVLEELTDPASFSPDLDKLAAFRLLFHAEVEIFLEAKASDELERLKAGLATGSWHRQHPNILSLYLLVRNFIVKNEDLTDSDLINHFYQIIGAARSRIKNNNGIKADAFTFLSVAAGKPLDEIDATLLSTLNSYGKDRGEVAHGTVARAHSLAAPSAEKTSGSNIVKGLGVYFDVTP